MRIERIDEMRLGPADEAEIAALVARCFGTEFGGRSFFMQRHHLRIVARDPAIVGHAAICLRAIRMGDRLVDIAGLAEVCTSPERRGEGIAGRILQDAIGAARDSPAAFFVLFGDRPLYAASGFEPASNPLRFVELDGARTGRVQQQRRDGLMVLPLGETAWDGAAEVDLMGNLF